MPNCDDYPYYDGAFSMSQAIFRRLFLYLAPYTKHGDLRGRPGIAGEAILPFQR